MLRAPLGWALALSLVACAGLPNPGAELLAPVPAAEEDLRAPGMIPAECEALLEKSRAWKHRPGEVWRPADLATAQEALEFFSRFHLVPIATSDFYRAVRAHRQPANAAEAQRLLDEVAKVQPCDAYLAHHLIEGLIRYRWPKGEKAKARDLLFRFVLNQQGRTMLVVPRLVSVALHRRALERGLSKGSLAEAKALEAEGERWIQAAKPEPVQTDAITQWRLLRQELDFAERVRERAARALPLP